MTSVSKGPAGLILVAMLAAPAWSAASAQQQEQDWAENSNEITIYGETPDDLSGLAEGPEIEGFISSRRGNEMQVTSAGGTRTDVLVADATEVRASGGFLGLGRQELAANALLNGIPVKVETRVWEGGLVASRIRFKSDDLETAQMIQGATEQRFAENEFAIDENAAATEALRGRVADIDQYNIKGTTNVYFDTGKWQLEGGDQQALCSAAQQANAMENALLLVVGYTDSVGDQDFNQTLSEKRAGRVVNFLQQECDWQPWRMLTPTGMAEADPMADNTTSTGRAQNRRVSVNILVSKAVDDMQG